MAASKPQPTQARATPSLVAQLRSVNEEIQRRDKERNAVLQTIQGLMAEHSLSIGDILGHARPAETPPPSSPVWSIPSASQRPALYMDPLSGKFWSGRGPCPKWLLGRLEQYRVGGF